RGGLAVERRVESLHQLDALVGAQRLEKKRRRIDLAAAPVGPDVEKLGPGETKKGDRRIARVVGDVLDQVDEHGLRPLQVVDDDHLRTLGGTRLEKSAE